MPWSQLGRQKQTNVNAREKHIISLHGAPLNNHFNICVVVRNETLKSGVASELPERYYFCFTQNGASMIMNFGAWPCIPLGSRLLQFIHVPSLLNNHFAFLPKLPCVTRNIHRLCFTNYMPVSHLL